MPKGPVNLTECEAGTKGRKGVLILLLVILAALGWYVLAQLAWPLADWLTSLQADKVRGLTVYFFLTVGAIVVAPLGTMPLVPLSAGLWGWQPVFLVSVAAWQLGAVVNFWLARKFGRRLLSKITDLDKVDALVSRFPHREQLGTIFLLRMIAPVDILSYALGFTTVAFRIYFWATLLGIMPFAFILSYGGEFLASWRIMPIAAGGVLLFWWAKHLIQRKLR